METLRLKNAVTIMSSAQIVIIGIIIFIYFSLIFSINLIGLPPTTQFSPTSFVATEFAPIIAFFPIFKPDKIVTLSPIQTLFSITGLSY